jgi:hypothetical protein
MAQSTTIKISTYSSVDFSQPGTWNLWQPENTDGFFTNFDYAVAFNYGDKNSNEEVYAVDKDGQDNVYIIGDTYNGTDSPKNIFNGYQVSFILKVNGTTGQQIWTKTLNASDNNDSYGMDIAINGSVMATMTYDYWNNGPVLTKLDLDGVVKWQVSLSNNGDGNGSVAIDANGDIYAVVEDSQDNRDGYTVYKFNPQGVPVWQRYLFGEGGNTYFNDTPGKKIAVDATHVYLTGLTYVPSNYAENGFIAKLPKDGTGMGSHGYWTYEEVSANYGKNNNTNGFIDISDRYVSDPSPNVDGGEIYTYSEWNATPQDQLTVMRDTDGGKIWFADGTSQDSTAQDVPQVLTRGGKLTLGMEHRGKHIYCAPTDSFHTIVIPQESTCAFPIGTVITVINDTGPSSGRTVYFEGESNNNNFTMVSPGINYTDNYWWIDSPGIATLMKVAYNRWMITGSPIHAD